MKKKNGFTLIELLAVIVILAIIALIATPIVLGLISRARKGAATDAAYGVRKEAQLVYSTALMEHPAGFNKIVVDFTKEVTENGKKYAEAKYYADTSVTDVTAKTDVVLFELDGTKPTSGIITILGTGKITYDDIVINGYHCDIPESGEITCGGSGSSNNNSGTTPTPVASVTITDKTQTSVEMGSTLTLTATASNTEDAISWSSSDTSVATVENGTVTPVSAGTTTITATAGGASDTIELTITVPAPTIATCPGCQFIYTTSTYAIEGISSDDGNNSNIPEGTTNDYTTLIGEGGHPNFLGIIPSQTNSNKIGRAFACGIENGIAFCLEGYDTSKYANPNITTLNTIYPSCNASASSSIANCDGSSVDAIARSTGFVLVYDDVGGCLVNVSGHLSCS